MEHLHLFNGDNFIVADADSSDSDTDEDDMLIPVEILATDRHIHTVLKDYLDNVDTECDKVAEGLQRDLHIFRFKIYLNDIAQANHVIYSDLEDNIVLTLYGPSSDFTMSY